VQYKFTSMPQTRAHREHDLAQAKRRVGNLLDRELVVASDQAAAPVARPSKNPTSHAHIARGQVRSIVELVIISRSFT
jgi:hypothetical protein